VAATSDRATPSHYAGNVFGKEQDVQKDKDSRVADENCARTIAELKAKLQWTEAELERAVTQRDYVLRLLQQQQTLSTTRIQNDAYAFFMERDSALARLLSRVPRGVKDLFPIRFKQYVRGLVVKIK
jgi:hypothetical protein